MIQLTPQLRICLYALPVDFRRGIDGLVGICKKVFQVDPFSGYLFVFTNRRRSGIKILVYDGNGFWLCYHRLSKGRLKWWPTLGQGESALMNFPVFELQSLLMNAYPDKSVGSLFRRVLQP